MKVMLLEQIAKVCYKYTFSLGNALVDCGNDVTLAIDQKTEPENCKCRRWNLFNSDEEGLSKIKKLGNYFSSYKKIYIEMRQNHYDVLHTQWLLFSPIDYYFINKIKNRCKVKLIVTIHDILPFNRKFYDYFFHKKVYELADRIILQADNNKERFKTLFPKNYEKCIVIPHGHFLEYAESASREESRKRLNITNEEFVFLFFGQIKKVKGVSVLLNAYAEFCKEKKDSLLILAGKVWKDDFTQYQSIIDENELTDRVRTVIKFIPDDEVKYYFAACDCCVLPYLDVYQSGVIQLCYSYKKPVIATDIGAFCEIVKDGENGYLCSANDSSSLCNAMKEAYEHREILSQLGNNGYEKIKDNFSWEKIGRSVKAVYEE